MALEENETKTYDALVLEARDEHVYTLSIALGHGVANVPYRPKDFEERAKLDVCMLGMVPVRVEVAGDVFIVAVRFD